MANYEKLASTRANMLKQMKDLDIDPKMKKHIMPGADLKADKDPKTGRQKAEDKIEAAREAARKAGQKPVGE